MTAAETWTNLSLTDDQAMLVDTVRKFVADQLAPHALQIDHSREFPRELFAEMAELGLLSLLVPESSGGAGMGVLAHCLALRELAEGSGAVAFSLLAHTSLAISQLLSAGSAAQHERWLELLATGEAIATFASLEPEAVQDPLGCATTAEAAGGGFMLRGTKTFVPNATAADLFVVVARTSARDLACFLVERGASRLTVAPLPGPLGMRGCGLGRLVLDGCTVPAGALLGAAEGGPSPARRTLDLGRVSMAFLALGLADKALALAARYAKERVAFGKPLAAQQAVLHKLGTMKARVEEARHLSFHAARSIQQDPSGDHLEPTAIAKAAASEAAVLCADEAIQVHGGYGFTTEYHVERLYRDAKVCTVFDQRNELLRMALAQRMLS